MLETLRKHQHGIMIVVAFLVIIAFAWFFNPYDTRQGNLNQAMAFKIGNKGVTVKEVQRQLRILQASSDLGFNFTMQLLQPTFDVVDFTQNRYLLGQEARKLGVDPSEAEVQKAIAAHPEFQRNGAFSEDAYNDALKNTVEPNGLVAGDLRDLMADKIRLEKVTALLSAGSAVPPSVVDVEFQREQELITASVIDFKLADFEDGIEVTDEELQTYYDEQKALYPSRERLAEGRLEADETAAQELLTNPEKRKIEFVFFEEPAAPAPPITAPPGGAAPGLQPPPLLQPSAGTSAPQINLTAPPIQPIEINPDPEAEPPGQAPEEAAAEGVEAAAEGVEAAKGALEDVGGLEIEPLPEIPDATAELELPPAEALGGDINVGDLNADPNAPAIDFGGEALDLNLEAAPPINAAPVAEVGTADDYQQEMRAYEKRVDKFYVDLEADPTQLATMAQNEGLEVKTTEQFTQAEPPTAPIVPSELVSVVFKGSMDTNQGLLIPVNGISPKGFYVARLLEVVEAKEYSLDEAKEELKKALTKKKAGEKLEEAVKAAREKLVAALEGGTSFADAAKAQELTVRDIPEFSVNKRPTGAETVTELMEAVPKTTTGSVSELTKAGDDAILVYVSQRVAASESEEVPEVPDVAGPPGAGQAPAEQKKNLADRLERQAGSGAMGLWIADRREAANIVRDPNRIPPQPYFPRSLFGGGGGGFGF